MATHSWLYLCLIIAATAIGDAQDYALRIEPPVRELQASEDRQLRISCSIDGVQNSGHVYWTINSREIKSDFIFFSKPTIADSGIYECHGAYEGWTSTKAIDIKFVAASSILDYEREQHPEIGTTARIQIAVSHPELATIFWTHNKGNINANKRLTYDEHKTALLIENYTSEDDGIYTLNLVHRFNDIESRQVAVSGYMRPTVTLDALEHADEGSNATLVCNMDGRPSPSVTWLRATQTAKAEPMKRSSKYVMETNSKESKLVITNISAIDIGNYSCQASNKLDTATKTRSLYVKLKPQINKLEPFLVDEDDRLMIPCATSETSATVRWLTGDGEDVPLLSASNETKQPFGYVPSSSKDGANSVTFVARNVTAAVDSNVECVAENSIGADRWRPTILLKRAPRIHKSPPPALRIVSGKNFELTCEGEGVPSLQWVWTHNEKPIESMSPFFVNSTERGKSILSVAYQPNLDGEYACEARNHRAIRAPPVRVFFVDPPQLPMIQCDKSSLPNRAICQMDTRLVDSRRQPIEYTIQLEHHANGIIVSSSSEIVSATGDSIRISGLRPLSSYQARFRGANEAGDTPFSEWHTINTTAARSPEPIDAAQISAACEGESCTLEWPAPEDNGAAIDNYTILVSQPNATGVDAFMPPLYNKTIDAPKIVLSPLPMNATYKLRLFATNAVGTAPFVDRIFVQNGVANRTWALVGIALLVAFILLLLVCCAIFLITKYWRKKRSDKTVVVRDTAAAEADQALLTLPPTTTTSPKAPTTVITKTTRIQQV